jgi:CubicO group peptidase (beta-lactamase class C family)
MTAGPATDWMPNLEAWFDERTTSGGFSGRAIAWRDGGPIFAYNGGLAHRGHGVPVADDTRFGVASITKMVTGISALRLVERGLIALDTPLVEVLPADQRPTALTREHTLHHLLSHTSGLANYHDDTSGVRRTCSRCLRACRRSPRPATRSPTTTPRSSSSGS